MLGVRVVAIAAMSILGLACGCSGDQSQPRSATSDSGGTGLREPSPEPPVEISADAGTSASYQPVELDPEGRVPNSGTIEILASWLSPPATAVRAPGITRCGSRAAPQVDLFVTGKIDAITALTSAVVWIEKIDSGRPAPPAQPVELAVSDCRLTPRVAIAPRIGANLHLINADRRRHLLTVEPLSGAAVEKSEVPLPLAGRRHQLPLAQPGIVRVSIDGEPHAHSYVVVPPHPYYARSNARGVATLEQVPAGRYRVQVWHPPLDRSSRPLSTKVELDLEAGETVRRVVELKPD